MISDEIKAYNHFSWKYINLLNLRFQIFSDASRNGKSACSKNLTVANQTSDVSSSYLRNSAKLMKNAFTSFICFYFDLLFLYMSWNRQFCFFICRVTDHFDLVIRYKLNMLNWHVRNSHFWKLKIIQFIFVLLLYDVIH